MTLVYMPAATHVPYLEEPDPLEEHPLVRFVVDSGLLFVGLVIAGVVTAILLLS